MHWWRHYYTLDVRFSQGDRSIDLWFEFPAGRRDELSRIVPALQVPEVQAEFGRHHEVFAPHNLFWFIRSRIYESPHQTVEDVPEVVLHEMLSAIARRREREADDGRRAVAAVYEEARPHLERRLDAVRSGPATADAIADELFDIAVEMERFGAPASSRTLMREAFAKAEGGPVALRVRIGLALGKRLVAGRQFEEAARTLERLRPAVSALPTSDTRVDEYWAAKIDAEIRAGFFEDAVASIQRKRTLCSSADIVDGSRMDEIRFLMGDHEGGRL